MPLEIFESNYPTKAASPGSGCTEWWCGWASGPAPSCSPGWAGEYFLNPKTSMNPFGIYLRADSAQENWGSELLRMRHMERGVWEGKSLQDKCQELSLALGFVVSKAGDVINASTPKLLWAQWDAPVLPCGASNEFYVIKIQVGLVKLDLKSINVNWICSAEHGAVVTSSHGSGKTPTFLQDFSPFPLTWFGFF